MPAWWFRFPTGFVAVAALPTRDANSARLKITNMAVFGGIIFTQGMHPAASLTDHTDGLRSSGLGLGLHLRPREPGRQSQLLHRHLSCPVAAVRHASHDFDHAVARERSGPRKWPDCRPLVRLPHTPLSDLRRRPQRDSDPDRREAVVRQRSSQASVTGVRHRFSSETVGASTISRLELHLLLWILQPDGELG